MNRLRAQQELSTDEGLVESARLALFRAQEALGVLIVAGGSVDAADEPTFDVPGDATDATLTAFRSDLKLLVAQEHAAERVVRDSSTDYWPSLTAIFRPQTTYPTSIIIPSGGVDFNTAIPYPEPFNSLFDAAAAWDAAHPEGSPEYKRDFFEKPDDGFNQGGYEWCVDHWGTKWNARDDGPIQRPAPRKATVLFMTAETPPVPVVKAWSAKYPTLTFSLRFEDATGRRGHYQARNGKKLVSPQRPTRRRRKSR